MDTGSTLDRYLAAVSEEGVYPNRGNLEFYVRYLFDGTPLSGATVLEIGGGAGACSYYAASAGARRVVCLEPESEGSSEGMGRAFRRLGERLRLPQVELHEATFQSYDPAPGEAFDLVLLHNSINHLDEDACIALRRDAAARARYRTLFDKMARLTRPGGRVLITDCTCYNVFNFVGLKNPLMPTIEWHKHQTPGTWIALLAESGYVRPRVRWTTLNILRRPGRILFGNAVAAFFLTSHFSLTMERV